MLSEIKTSENKQVLAEIKAMMFITALLYVVVKNYLLKYSQGIRKGEAMVQKDWH